MTDEQFRSVMQRRPFIPFRVHSGSGESYEVRHPEGVWQSLDGDTVIIQTNKGARVVMMGVEHINEVTFDVVKQTA